MTEKVLNAYNKLRRSTIDIIDVSGRVGRILQPNCKFLVWSQIQFGNRKHIRWSEIHMHIAFLIECFMWKQTLNNLNPKFPIHAAPSNCLPTQSSNTHFVRSSLRLQLPNMVRLYKLVMKIIVEK